LPAGETDRIAEILRVFRREAAGISSRAQFEALKGKYLGRPDGLLAGLFEELRRTAPSERAAFGKRANEAKQEIEAALEKRGRELAQSEAQARDRAAAVDVTLPGRPSPVGSLHPVTVVQRQIEDFFLRLGYAIADGPELETDYFNFEALNFPPEHPARDTQDTLLVSTGAGDQPEFLLRTHTSPVQIRSLSRFGAPLRIVIPGRVYRKDNPDATHSPVFHQAEGLLVDKGISLAHLKGTLDAFARALFGSGTRTRFSCSYFPFVEPGAEVAATCIFCKGAGCKTCKGSGWIEILGAGMVHPNVLKACGVESETYSGFAFGIGIDRVAILKHDIPDIRLLFENDVRFLSQYRGAA
jgi:phenylalanyl-tRNA synthetase alpha chain